MSRTATQSARRRVDRARRQRRIARCLLAAMGLAALYLLGQGLLPAHPQERLSPAWPATSTMPYRRVPALLAQARAHDPLLRLPHARWFIRVHHGHAQLIVVDHAPLQDGSGG